MNEPRPKELNSGDPTSKPELPPDYTVQAEVGVPLARPDLFKHRLGNPVRFRWPMPKPNTPPPPITSKPPLASPDFKYNLMTPVPKSSNRVDKPDLNKNHPVDEPDLHNNSYLYGHTTKPPPPAPKPTSSPIPPTP